MNSEGLNLSTDFHIPAVITLNMYKYFSVSVTFTSSVLRPDFLYISIVLKLCNFFLDRLPGIVSLGNEQGINE